MVRKPTTVLEKLGGHLKHSVAAVMENRPPMKQDLVTNVQYKLVYAIDSNFNNS